MDNIVCPHCGKKVQLSEAIIHQLQSKVRDEERKKLEAQFEEQKAKEAALREKQLRKEFEEESKEKEKEFIELEKKIELQEKESARKEEKIKAQAFEEASKQGRLDKLELEKKLTDTQIALEKAQRKAKQGSQQLQGDVLEIDLKEKLTETFQYDSILDVPTGIRGADLIQEVKNKFGNKAGTILWETKRQKDWNKAWLPKLRDDMRKIEASSCILVSDVLPPNIKVYEQIDNVWVTSYEYAINLANALRLGILNVAIARSGSTHTDENLKKFYEIVSSDRFKNALEARKEIIATLEKELEADKASTERKWRRQADSIDKLKSNNRELVGMLEDHVPSLKSLSDIEYQLLREVKDDDQETLI